MSASPTPIRLTTSWQSLGIGPLAVQVLSGVAVLLASDSRPAADTANGAILGAIVGAAPTPLGTVEEWWAKALVTGTVIAVTVGAAVASSTADTSTPGVAVPVYSVNGKTGQSLTLAAADIGAATPALVDERIAAAVTEASALAVAQAVAQATQNALTPPGSLELISGIINPAW